ncbi:NTP transferase domain-containing protein, partial [Candidatus Peregrinibacteria bacterium]|nr:NTP transferase domain-containing protein [Candidatus Peregrinibacteria bacterium]
MKTILLLAGRSRRFWPLQEKYLFPLLGKTVLEHQIDHLKEEGCNDLLLVVGPHNKKEIKKILPGIAVVEQKDLNAGMQGALLDALPRCKKEPVLIVGSDLLDTDVFRTVLSRFKNTKADGLILARAVKRYFPGGYLTMKGKRITGIAEKPGAGKEPSKLVSIVVHAHRNASALLAALKKTSAKDDDGYERALAGLFKDHVYEAVRYEHAWFPVKYPWHLLELLPFLLNRLKKQSIHRTAKIHPSAVIDGPVVIEEGVRVLPHATIVGPAYIGKHTIVGNNALVRQASTGEHCVIGYNTEIKGSALGRHVWTHSTYIGDSIVGENVSFGAGCVTGNLRLDEEEIHTRLGATHIPSGLTKFGTIIGDNCRIG